MKVLYVGEEGVLKICVERKEEDTMRIRVEERDEDTTRRFEEKEDKTWTKIYGVVRESLPYGNQRREVAIR